MKLQTEILKIKKAENTQLSFMLLQVEKLAEKNGLKKSVDFPIINPIGDGIEFLIDKEITISNEYFRRIRFYLCELNEVL